MVFAIIKLKSTNLYRIIPVKLKLTFNEGGGRYMARLYEYQGKNILKEFRINVPRGGVASTPSEVRKIAEEIGGPIAIKAQVWFTGRMKRGLIKFANNPFEAEKIANELLGGTVGGFKIEKILVEEKIDFIDEYYVGVIVDDSYKVRAPVIMVSSEGGIEIEEIARKYPDKIASKSIDVSNGLSLNEARELIMKLNVPSNIIDEFSNLIVNVYDVFRKYHASSVEINPLALTKDNRLIALDCRISIDDSSVFMHPELGIEVARESDRPPTELDKIAWKVEESDYRGVFYFMQLASPEETIKGGYVGYHGIGGGGSIVGLDALIKVGLKPANFADTSGNPPASKVYKCAKIILAQPGIEGYFLGGFCIASQEQWHHAHGLVKAFREELKDKPGFPVIIVIAGNKEEETIQILKDGLKDLPIKLEIYGRDYLDKAEFIAQRMKQLVEEYRKLRGKKV